MIIKIRNKELLNVVPVAPYKLDPMLLGRSPAWFKPIGMLLLYTCGLVLWSLRALPAIAFLILCLGMLSFTLRMLWSVLRF
ncbi:MAG: hypothetical protein U0795_24305 [Pirellulales bacterium]